MGDRGNISDDLITSILGDADPGDTGKQDEGGQDDENDELDTGAVDDGDTEDQDEDQDQDQDEDTGGQDDDDGAPEDEDALAAAARTLRNARGKRGKDTQDGDDDTPSDIFNPDTQVTTDKNGNVFVGKKLVAKAGREARLFMGWRKSAVAAHQETVRQAKNAARVADGVRELNARYEQLKTQKSLFDSAGITAEEQALLLPIAQAYKRNPVEGIKMLLTRAHMAGVDIKQLGVGGALDPKVLMEDLKSYVGEQLKPLRDQTTKSENQDKLRTEARELVQSNPRFKVVAKALGGSHKVGELLRDAKTKAPDLSLADLFERLDYALLREFGGKLPTGPVEEKRNKPNGKNQKDDRATRRMARNFSSTVSKSNPSFEEIAASVLRDAQAAESRGF